MCAIILIAYGPIRSSLPAGGLEHQRVEAIVVFGRQDRVRILQPYLRRNLRRYGGLIDVVHFVVFAAMPEESLRFISKGAEI